LEEFTTSRKAQAWTKGQKVLAWTVGVLTAVTLIGGYYNRVPVYTPDRKSGLYRRVKRWNFLTMWRCLFTGNFSLSGIKGLFTSQSVKDEAFANGYNEGRDAEKRRHEENNQEDYTELVITLVTDKASTKQRRCRRECFG
jgi:hypothetical protein